MEAALLAQSRDAGVEALESEPDTYEVDMISQRKRLDVCRDGNATLATNSETVESNSETVEAQAQAQIIKSAEYPMLYTQ